MASRERVERKNPERSMGATSLHAGGRARSAGLRKDEQSSTVDRQKGRGRRAAEALNWPPPRPQHPSAQHNPSAQRNQSGQAAGPIQCGSPRPARCSLDIAAAQHVGQQEGKCDPVGEGGSQARARHAPTRAKHKRHQQAQVQHVGEDAGCQGRPARSRRGGKQAGTRRESLGVTKKALSGRWLHRHSNHSQLHSRLHPPPSAPCTLTPMHTAPSPSHLVSLKPRNVPDST